MLLDYEKNLAHTHGYRIAKSLTNHVHKELGLFIFIISKSGIRPDGDNRREYDPNRGCGVLQLCMIDWALMSATLLVRKHKNVEP